MPDEYNSHILQHDIGQNILHTNQDDTTEIFRNQETSHFNNIPDASETATIQSVSELSEKTTQNPKSNKITDDSNIVQILVYNITQTIVNDQTPNDTIHNTNQDKTSTLSTSSRLTNQELQPQQTMQRKFDPPPPPPSRFAPLTAPHKSPQKGSSSTQNTNTVHNTEQQLQKDNQKNEP